MPRTIIAALRAGDVDLTNPSVTVELLRLNAVVGVQGKVNDAGVLTSVGITCALCHSSVDNSFATGIGRRLDGWANTDLNVGAIVALSPALDEATKTEFKAWGPGKYDPRHHAFDGTNLLSLNRFSLDVSPPIYDEGVGSRLYGRWTYRTEQVSRCSQWRPGRSAFIAGILSRRRRISSHRRWQRCVTIN